MMYMVSGYTCIRDSGLLPGTCTIVHGCNRPGGENSQPPGGAPNAPAARRTHPAPAERSGAARTARGPTATREGAHYAVPERPASVRSQFPLMARSLGLALWCAVG
eukprot:SAG31_NODE_35978_length_317_cov_1.839450_1_plen_105_part_11